MHMDLKGGISYSSLNKPPGNLSSGVQLPQMWLGTLRKGDGSFHWKLIQRFQGSQVNIRLNLSSPICIFSSALWNLVKFDIYGKSFSRSIQYCWLQGVWGKACQECWRLPGVNHLTQIRNIGAFLIQLAPHSHWTSSPCVKCSPSVLSCFQWGLECFGGWKVGSISRISRI